MNVGAEEVQPIEFPAQVLNAGNELVDHEAVIDEAGDHAERDVVLLKGVRDVPVEGDVDFLEGVSNFEQQHAEGVRQSPALEVDEGDLGFGVHIIRKD